MGQGVTLKRALESKRSFLLDTNAISACWKKEPLAKELLSGAGRPRLFTTVANLVECILEADRTARAAANCETRIRALVGEVLPPTPELAFQAMRIFKESRAIPVGVGDAYVAAAARLNRLVIVTQDPDFRGVDDIEFLVEWVSKP